MILMISIIMDSKFLGWEFSMKIVVQSALIVLKSVQIVLQELVYVIKDFTWIKIILDA